MPGLNVTMVAFYGRAKPEPLEDLLRDVLGAVSSSLPPSLSCSFRSYEFEQMHATIMGLEVDDVGGRMVGRWLNANKAQPVAIEIDGLHNILKRLDRAGKPLFTVRFGGFPEAYCKCSYDYKDALNEWSCKSASPRQNTFHSCDRTPYEGSFYAFAPGPTMISGWPIDGPDEPDTFPHSLYELRRSMEQCGFADKYHYGVGHERAHWKDDDCFIRVGTFVGPVRAQQLRAVEDAVRNFLSARRPVVVDVSVDDVSFVLYDDPSLLGDHVRNRVSLREFLTDPSTVSKLYDILRNRGG